MTWFFPTWMDARGDPAYGRAPLPIGDRASAFTDLWHSHATQLLRAGVPPRQTAGN